MILCPKCKGRGQVRDPKRILYFVVKSSAGTYSAGSTGKKPTKDRSKAFSFRPDECHSIQQLSRWANSHAEAMQEVFGGAWRAVAVVRPMVTGGEE